MTGKLFGTFFFLAFHPRNHSSAVPPMSPADGPFWPRTSLASILPRPSLSSALDSNGSRMSCWGRTIGGSPGTSRFHRNRSCWAERHCRALFKNRRTESEAESRAEVTRGKNKPLAGNYRIQSISLHVAAARETD
jgi:hypothetical protein